MKNKKINKIFIITIIIEIILMIILSFVPFYWPNSCVNADFFHPFGKEISPEMVCLEAFTRGPNPFFILSIWLLIFTIITFIIYLLVNKFRKRKR